MVDDRHRRRKILERFLYFIQSETIGSFKVKVFIYVRFSVSNLLRCSITPYGCGDLRSYLLDKGSLSIFHPDIFLLLSFSFSQSFVVCLSLGSSGLFRRGRLSRSNNLLQRQGFSLSLFINFLFKEQEDIKGERGMPEPTVAIHRQPGRLKASRLSQWEPSSPPPPPRTTALILSLSLSLSLSQSFIVCLSLGYPGFFRIGRLFRSTNHLQGQGEFGSSSLNFLFKEKEDLKWRGAMIEPKATIPSEPCRLEVCLSQPLGVPPSVSQSLSLSLSLSPSFYLSPCQNFFVCVSLGSPGLFCRLSKSNNLLQGQGEFDPSF